MPNRVIIKKKKKVFPAMLSTLTYVGVVIKQNFPAYFPLSTLLVSFGWDTPRSALSIFREIIDT